MGVRCGRRLTAGLTVVVVACGVLAAVRAGEKAMNASADLARAHLRVARPSDDLDAVVKFYRDGLGFAVLYQFKDHDGFDGVMLGHPGAAYHLEFTRKKGHKAGRAPTEDNLLVFYLPDESEWRRATERMARRGYRPVKAFNPYWDKKGRTYEDPDGYRVVLQNAKWAG
jgi:catechol 2,3-dioxygenase-like lactoylglutathione lyase family enzyme